MDSNKELTNGTINVMTFYREMDTLEAPMILISTLNKKRENGFTYVYMLIILS